LLRKLRLGKPASTLSWRSKAKAAAPKSLGEAIHFTRRLEINSTSSLDSPERDCHARIKARRAHRPTYRVPCGVREPASTRCGPARAMNWRQRPRVNDLLGKKATLNTNFPNLLERTPCFGLLCARNSRQISVVSVSCVLSSSAPFHSPQPHGAEFWVTFSQPQTFIDLSSEFRSAPE
jgi:hypothetical protein